MLTYGGKSLAEYMINLNIMEQFTNLMVAENAGQYGTPHDTRVLQ